VKAKGLAGIYETGEFTHRIQTKGSPIGRKEKVGVRKGGGVADGTIRNEGKTEGRWELGGPDEKWYKPWSRGQLKPLRAFRREGHTLDFGLRGKRERRGGRREKKTSHKGLWLRLCMLCLGGARAGPKKAAGGP